MCKSLEGIVAHRSGCRPGQESLSGFQLLWLRHPSRGGSPPLRGSTVWWVTSPRVKSAADPALSGRVATRKRRLLVHQHQTHSGAPFLREPVSPDGWLHCGIGKVPSTHPTRGARKLRLLVGCCSPAEGSHGVQVVRPVYSLPGRSTTMGASPRYGRFDVNFGTFSGMAFDGMRGSVRLSGEEDLLLRRSVRAARVSPPHFLLYFCIFPVRGVTT